MATNENLANSSWDKVCKEMVPRRSGHLANYPYVQLLLASPPLEKCGIHMAVAKTFTRAMAAGFAPAFKDAATFDFTNAREFSTCCPMHLKQTNMAGQMLEQLRGNLWR